MRPAESRGRGFGEQLKALRALGGREGADGETAGLTGDRLAHHGMGMAEARDGDSREKIEIDVAVGVGQRRAVAMIEGNAGEQRDALPAGRDKTLLAIENRAR